MVVMNNIPSLPNQVYRKKLTGIVLMLLLYGIFICVFSFYPRGSDQFWNLGNIERVLEIDGLYKTNNIFPAGMPENINDLPRPWIQNRPVTYLGILFAKIVGDAHLGWMLMNFLLTTAIVFSFFKIIAQRTANHFLILPVIALLIYNPLMVYLGMQALPEIFNTAVVLSIVLVALFPISVILNAILLGLLTGLLYFQRESYVLAYFLIIGYLFVFYKGKQSRLSLLVFTLVFAGMYLLRPVLFPYHTIEPISAIEQLTEVRQGHSNMINYLYPDEPEHSLPDIVSIVFSKAIRALKFQFIPSGPDTIFFYTINLLLIPLILLLRKFKKLSAFQKQAVFLITGITLIQFFTVVVFENQYRFSAVLIPLLLLCMYWYLDMQPSGKVWWKYPLYFIMCLSVIASVFVGIQNKKSALEDKKFINELKALKPVLSNDAVMIPYYGGTSILISYALMPNSCYYFPGKMNREKLWKEAEKLNTNWFLYPSNIRFATEIEPYITETHKINNRFLLSKLRFPE